MQEVDRVKPTANFIGVSEWKLREMVNKRQIPHFRVGRIILFRRDSILNWMAEAERKQEYNKADNRLDHLLKG